MSEQQQPEQDWAREAEGRICDEIARVLGGRDAGMAKANIDIAALIREAQPIHSDWGWEKQAELEARCAEQQEAEGNIAKARWHDGKATGLRLAGAIIRELKDANARHTLNAIECICPDCGHQRDEDDQCANCMKRVHPPPPDAAIEDNHRTTTLLLRAERDWAKANIAQARAGGRDVQATWNAGYLYAIEKLIKCLGGGESGPPVAACPPLCSKCMTCHHSTDPCATGKEGDMCQCGHPSAEHDAGGKCAVLLCECPRLRRKECSGAERR